MTTTTEQGYGWRDHQIPRKQWQRRLNAGEVIYCRRRDYGCFTPDIPVPRQPDQWQLGHPDATCPLPKAPEHLRCNEATMTSERRAARVVTRWNL